MFEQKKFIIPGHFLCEFVHKYVEEKLKTQMYQVTFDEGKNIDELPDLTVTVSSKV